MKTCIFLLLYVGVLVVSAQSKIWEKLRKRAAYCGDVAQNCADLNQANHICSDAGAKVYAQHVCAKTCNMCGGTMTGGTGTMTGGTGTITGGTGTMTGGTGTGSVTGGTGTMTGSCSDAIANCAAYDPSICTRADYKQWASQNCAGTCHLCSSQTSGGTVTGSGGGDFMTDCGDVAQNCADLNQANHICSNAGAKVYAQHVCAKTCNMCGGSCSDTIANCAAYDPSICTRADYKQWASQNCAGTCHLCSSQTGTGGSGTGTMTRTGTGTGGAMTGSSSGCVYAGHLYTQGQSWKDGCKFRCQCVEGATGKYQCTQLCVQWQLPQQCHMNPPAPGKCCQTPSCPAGFDIKYPVGYTEE